MIYPPEITDWMSVKGWVTPGVLCAVMDARAAGKIPPGQFYEVHAAKECDHSGIRVYGIYWHRDIEQTPLPMGSSVDKFTHWLIGRRQVGMVDA